jgi:hypothetical protein
MATTTELQEERAELVLQLAAVNARILAILQRNNKKYTYSNQETTHSAETHSLSELRDMRKDIKDQIAVIDAQLGRGYFIKVKNC